MKLASKSAIESDSSANAGSNDSRGASAAPIILDLPDSRKEDRDEGRKGVVGRDVGRRLLEPNFLVLLSRGVVDDDMVLAVLLSQRCCRHELEEIRVLDAPKRVTGQPKCL